MSALVSYVSSGGEDEDDDIHPEKPAKMAKLGEDEAGLRGTNAVGGTQPAIATPKTREPAKAPLVPAATHEAEQESSGPTQGPSIPLTPTAEGSTTTPPSPYTTTRLQTRSLTLPPIPNFHIPSSPSPPPPNTETSTTLATTTNKLTHFLELKNQGVHFNARLETSVSLRNPGLLPKLMEFAGMTREEGYGSTVSVGSWSESEGGVEGGGKGGVPGKWREEWYVEGLVKENERRERQRMAGRGEVEFVPAAAGAVKSVGDLGASGATGTTAGGGGGGGGREGGKRSRFDKR